MKVKQRCYVLGAGGIGMFLAYVLGKSHDVALLARPQSVEALKKKPLKISGLIDDFREIDAKLLNGSDSFAENDILFIATKATDVEPLLSSLQSRLAAGCTVVLCQNGIGIFDLGRSILQAQNVLRLNCWLGVRRLSPHEINLAGVYKFDLSGDSSAQKAIEQVRGLFNDTGYSITYSHDPRLAEWQKALWNIAVNGLCSIVNEKNGAILDSPELRHIANQLLSEAQQVALQSGIPLSQEDLDKVFQSLEKTRGNINATLQDLRAGRHPELDFLNGAVIKQARQNDQNAPVNETIMSLVTYLEKTGARRQT